LPNEQGATFPRSRRLLKPDDYRRVFSEGRRSADSLFLVLAIPSGLSQARLGLAVSKKNSRRAVDRNRIKRLIRESFRQHQQELAGLDLVVVSRQGITGGDNKVCFASLSRHWRRVAEKCVEY
jgi:ribonuclease P protein component